VKVYADNRGFFNLPGDELSCQSDYFSATKSTCVGCLSSAFLRASILLTQLSITLMNSSRATRKCVADRRTVSLRIAQLLVLWYFSESSCELSAVCMVAVMDYQQSVLVVFR